MAVEPVEVTVGPARAWIGDSIWARGTNLRVLRISRLRGPSQLRAPNLTRHH